MHPQNQTLSPALSRLLAHLDREESLLRECLGGLVRLHKSLQRSDGDSADKARVTISTSADGTAALAPLRTRLIQQLALELRIAFNRPTLSDLVAALPDDAAQELRTRQRSLGDLTRDLRQYHRRCADLLAYSRMFLTRLLREALPGSAAGPRYGPAGTPTDVPAPHPLARG